MGKMQKWGVEARTSHSREVVRQQVLCKLVHLALSTKGPEGISFKFEWQRSRTKEPVIHDVEDALEAEATQMRADPRMEDGSIWIKPSHQHPSTTSVHSLQLAWMY